jgi:hypothetical protein
VYIELYTVPEDNPAWPQIVPNAAELGNADYYNFKEWEREFEQFAASGELPALEFVRFPHDHLGSFGTARYRVNTPTKQMADNDYAIGLLVEKIAQSRFAQDTLIFIIEDDAQDGPDHVDAHRSIAYVDL